MTLRLILVAIVGSMFLQACVEDECSTTFTFLGYKPVYKSLDDLKDEIVFESDRPMKNPGKIYYYDTFVLISERDEGVHVVDNSDIRNPVVLGFIAIPGNQDIAMTDHYIFADTKYNIAIIDIENIREPEIAGFIDNVKDITIDRMSDGRIVVDYVLTGQTLEVSCDDYRNGMFYDQLDGILFVERTISILDAQAGVPDGNRNGIAGSLSRMALFDDHFYYINDYKMSIFSVRDPENPEALNEVYMEWGIETIFPYEDKLFIGARNGMHIFDNSDPANPGYLSTFSHANACDPVAIEGQTAYITLRDGNDCENFFNQLDVVDIQNLLNPQLIKSYPMNHPFGLSVRNQILYLCDDDEGLKIYDVSDPQSIDRNLLANPREYTAYDVISVSDNLLMMIGEDGFYQWNVGNPSSPELLSVLEVGDR